MKRVSVFILIFFVLMIMIGCQSNSKLFNNHIIIYSYEGEKLGIDSNYQFVDFYQDTIHWVEWTYVGGRFKFDSAHAAHISGKYTLYPPFASSSFKLTKNGREIFIGYEKQGKKITRKRYTVNTGDTVKRINDLFSPCNEVLAQSSYSLYQGDTLIRFHSRRLKCWKFEEHYVDYPQIDYSGAKIQRIIYVEQKTLLPVRIEFARSQYADIEETRYFFNVSYVLKRDSVAKWLPSQCY